jgi:acetylornithine deacetylase/succinyl-diaminopimelate desuccinylase-like protein
MTRAIFLISFLVAGMLTSAFAQVNPAATAARQWRERHERTIVDEFFSLLAIPNIARDRDNIARNADLIKTMMEKRGIAAQLVSVPGVNPVVFGDIATPGATRTIVFYAHYDGQPLDPKEWATPPFSPVLKASTGGTAKATEIPLPPPDSRFDPEWRIYARSAGDDKAPIIALMSALDAIRAAGLTPRSNIKFAFEGEEEAGSPNFAKILSANKVLFSGDVWLSVTATIGRLR